MTVPPSRARIVITSIETQDGRKVIPPTAGVTVIVGANNSGKSTFLREIGDIAATEPHLIPSPKLLKGFTLQTEGTAETLLEELRVAGLYMERGPQNSGYKFASGVMHENVVRRHWDSRASGKLGNLAQFFIYHVTATNRIGGVSPQVRRADIADPPENPMHVLEDNEDILEKVQGISTKIFRETLTLDRISNNIQLRVGEPSIPAPPIDKVTKEYRAALIALDRLQDQGDGMTAVLGLLVPVICGRQNIALIDEPEAFLHPPQARVVGELLGQLSVERDMQILLATHDRNVLIGLLQSRVPVTVVRLDRSTLPTSVHILDYEQVRNLWDDPVLRYSNLLDGLFHHAVVLCEAERDCTFYSASLDTASEHSKLSFSPGDILFVPSGGKDGFHGMVKALKAVSVPVTAIPDIDLLDDKSKLRLLFEAMGGYWRQIDSSYNIATQKFHQPRREVTNAQILNALQAALSPKLAEKYDSNMRETLRAAMRIDPSPWAELKQYGMDAFQGQARTEATKMLERLRAVGLVLVERGELENLAPSVESKKGKNWINEALQKRAHQDRYAQEHISQVICAITHLLGSDPHATCSVTG